MYRSEPTGGLHEYGLGMGTEQHEGVRLGVLASGTGSLLQAIIGAGIDVCVVVADRPCPALGLAREAGLPSELVLRDSFGASFDRHGYTRRLVATLQQHRVEVVAMAGFGTVLHADMCAAFPGRVLNTHPALLPAFKGWHAVRDALAAGVAVTGTTVHIATAAVDNGPVLAQEEVPVLEGDTEESLHERIKEVERRLYPETIRRFITELQQRRRPTCPAQEGSR